MNEVEIVDALQKIQHKKTGKRGKDKLNLALKRVLLQHIRRGYQVPLCLGWYAALNLEDPAAAGNDFLDVQDTTHFLKNRGEGTFAVAWSYIHLRALDDSDRERKYDTSDIYIILDEYFGVSKRTVKAALTRYGSLVQALERREFTPDSVNPTFARYAIEQVYIYDKVEDKDVYFDAILEDGTLIQYFRDGHFRALNPMGDAKFSSVKDIEPPGHRHTRITYQQKNNDS